MKFITEQQTLVKEFERLCNQYCIYKFAVAWAGDPFNMEKVLWKNKKGEGWMPRGSRGDDIACERTLADLQTTFRAPESAAPRTCENFLFHCNKDACINSVAICCSLLHFVGMPQINVVTLGCHYDKGAMHSSCHVGRQYRVFFAFSVCSVGLFPLSLHL